MTAPVAEAEVADEWDAPPRVPAVPELHLDGFDGPMDLLLGLAERQRIDLGRLSMLDLVEQFVAAMDGLRGQVAPERQAEWLVLAARLVLLRSRLMLPGTVVEARNAEQDAAAEEQRLVERLRMRAAAAWLEARPQLGQEVFSRPTPGRQGRSETTMALLEACLVVLRGPSRPEAVPVYRPAVVRLWRVEQALARIRQMLAEDPQGGELARFLPAVGQGADRLRQVRGAVASTFVACLELARQGEIEAKQEETFDPVRIRYTAADPKWKEVKVLV